MKMLCRKSSHGFLLVAFSNGFLCASFSPSASNTKNGQNSLRRWDRTMINSMISDDEEPATPVFSKNFASICFASSVMIASFGMPLPAVSAIEYTNEEVQGIGAVTNSNLGKSVRRSIVGGAQLADNIDLKWERFSDSLRDEKKCDPRTNRRMFDNGTRRDGTKIGNPVLGALCTPEPLRAFDSEAAMTFSDLAQEAMKDTFGLDSAELQRKEEVVKEKVGAAFSRAVATTSSSEEEKEQERIRQGYNRDLYIRMRAYGELIPQKRENARALENSWGNKMLAKLAPNANRNDYSSPFPKPDPSDEQPYDEGALLDALGGVSVVLSKMQDAGLIGHWEISIPEDDYWNVITIAVDDDISIGGQMLSRESNQPLSGSAVVALVRSAMGNKAKIPYKMDTFFIDPTTTRQELYNPTQLLVSLSDLGQ